MTPSRVFAIDLAPGSRGGKNPLAHTQTERLIDVGVSIVDDDPYRPDHDHLTSAERQPINSAIDHANLASQLWEPASGNYAKRIPRYMVPERIEACAAPTQMPSSKMYHRRLLAHIQGEGEDRYCQAIQSWRAPALARPVVRRAAAR